MKNIYREYLKKSVRLSLLAGLAMSLSGCLIAVPPAIQLASLALDGISYATTGKSVTDHAISTVTAQDCAMTRALQGEDICTAKPVQVAMTSPDTTTSNTATTNEDRDEILDLSNLPTDDLDMEVAAGQLY